METCSRPCSHKLPAGLADYIKRFISEHVTDKEVKENILTEKNVPSNIKGKPIFGQVIKELLLEIKTTLILNHEEPLRSIHDKVTHVFIRFYDFGASWKKRKKLHFRR